MYVNYSGWAYGLLLYLGYCELHCSKHGLRGTLSHADFISFGFIPRSGMTGLYGRSVFRYLRSLPAVFHSAWPGLPPLQQWHPGTVSSNILDKSGGTGGSVSFSTPFAPVGLHVLQGVSEKEPLRMILQYRSDRSRHKASSSEIFFMISKNSTFK